jgi:hypothetical protein
MVAPVADTRPASAETADARVESERGYHALVTESGVVVGSGPAGVPAAESLREHDSRLPVRIFTANIDLGERFITKRRGR